MRIPSRLPIGLSLLALAVVAVPGRAADAEKYLPNDSDAIVVLRVQTLLNAALVQRNLDQIKPALKKNEEYQKTIDALGIDPFKDIELILIGGPIGGDADNKAVTVIQGKFNVAKARAVAAKHAKDNPDVLKIEKVGGTEVYTITPSGGKQKTTYAVLLDDHILIGSPSRDAVTDAIDKKSGQKKSELKKVLTELLAKQDVKQALSIVADDAVGIGELVGLLKSVTGGLTVGEDLKLDLTLNAKDEKTATALADKGKEFLKTMMFIVMGMSSKDKRFEPLLDVAKSIKVVPVESTVSLKAEASKDVIEKLEKALKEARAPKAPKDSKQ